MVPNIYIQRDLSIKFKEKGYGEYGEIFELGIMKPEQLSVPPTCPAMGATGRPGGTILFLLSVLCFSRFLTDYPLHMWPSSFSKEMNSA